MSDVMNSKIKEGCFLIDGMLYSYKKNLDRFLKVQISPPLISSCRFNPVNTKTRYRTREPAASKSHPRGPSQYKYYLLAVPVDSQHKTQKLPVLNFEVRMGSQPARHSASIPCHNFMHCILQYVWFSNYPCTPLPNFTTDNRQQAYTVFRKDTTDLKIRTCCSQFSCHLTQKRVRKNTVRGKYFVTHLRCNDFLGLVVHTYRGTRVRQLSATQRRLARLLRKCRRSCHWPQGSIKQPSYRNLN
jgi:hypothetical protein